MPELNNNAALDPALAAVLADLEFSISQATAIGTRESLVLAEELRVLVRAHQAGLRILPAAGAAPTATTTTTTPDAAAVTPAIHTTGAAVANDGEGQLAGTAGADEQEQHDESDDEPVNEFNDELDDELAAVGDAVLDDMRQNALPQGMSLFVTRQDGFPLSLADADSALAVAMPPMREFFPQVAAAAGEQDPEDPSRYEYRLTGIPSWTLSAAGAGRDAINATIPLSGVGLVSITSRVDDPADPELAAELGYVRERPEVPEGQHPINAVLIQADADGADVQLIDFQVRYSRPDGNTEPLTTEQVQQVLAHQVSTAGLTRFGDYTVTGILDGAFETQKVATFAFRNAGEIDPRTVALNCTNYRGTFDFGAGIGVVTARAEANVTGNDYGDDYDEDDYEG